MSAPQDTHAPLPESAYVPAVHVDIVPDSPHAAPFGHTAHVVRVAASPPLVNDPTGHRLQLAAVAELYFWLVPHGVHAALLPPLKYPAVQAVAVLLPLHAYPAAQAVHVVRVVVEPPLLMYPPAHVTHTFAPAALYCVSVPHAVTTFPPSHLDPALHSVHDVRVVAVPPFVKNPAAHVLHSVAPVVDVNLLSRPQSSHFVAPLLTYLPRAHSVTWLVPSHDDPVTHFEHVVREVWSLPDVKDPGAQVEQSLEAAPLNFESSAHRLHELDPATEYVPAEHGLAVL